MSAIFPSVHVGEPIRHQQLSIFPLFADAPAPVEYVLGADAINDGSVLVEEISEAGSVPTLSVTNKANRLVLFLEGEQLIGAKQNRILNTSILVAANSKTTIPVSCVEQGRWRFKSKQFGSSGTHSPSKLRYALKMSVSESVQKGQGHRSDQGRVWAEVTEHQKAHGVASESSAMEDTFESYRGQLDELQKRFTYVEGACGVAVALGKEIVCLDLFDKPSTCGKVWDRLLSGALLESFSPSTDENQTGVADVESFIAELGTAPWESATSVGEGQEFRSATEQGTQASALCFSERVVHGSAVAAGQS
jgi:hypothetical protein